MLFKMEDLRDPKGIFDGWGNNHEFSWTDWRSKLPSTEVREFFKYADPAYDYMVESGHEMSQILGISSVISAVRNVISKISMAWGWYTSAISPIINIFKDTVAQISEILATANAVLAGISLAIDFLSFIPVVGWVIAIIKAIVEIILGVVSKIRKAADAKRAAIMAKQARQLGLPVVEWQPDFDTLMCQMLQRQVSAEKMNLEWCFLPRYPAKSASDFQARQQKINPGEDECYFGWLVHPRVEEGIAPGLGFVPGTMNIHGAMQIQVRGGIMDLGEYFPVTKAVAGNLWNQTLKGESGMTFAIDTEKCINSWKDYISAAYGFGSDRMGGWTKVGGEVGSDLSTFKCTSCDYNIPGCDKRGHRKGAWLNVPKSGHRSSWMPMLHELFDWKTRENGKTLSEDDWWETTRPVQAMRNLKERQIAMIQSRKCMYLDDSTNANGSHNPRFRAIRKGTDLHKLWDQCVAAMIESGDWKTIDYRDVIPGEEVDKALRTLLSNRYNTTPEKYFNMESSNVVGGMAGRASLGIQRPNWKSVLGDPAPPDPPTQVNIMRLKIPRAGSTGPTDSTSSRRKRNKSNTPLALAAAAAAGLLLTRK